MVKCNEKQNQSFFHLEGLVLLILDQYNSFFLVFVCTLALENTDINTEFGECTKWNKRPN